MITEVCPRYFTAILRDQGLAPLQEHYGAEDFAALHFREG
jgi:hypothetical protein